MRVARGIAVGLLFGLAACTQEPLAPPMPSEALVTQPGDPDSGGSLACESCLVGPVNVVRVKGTTNRFAFAVNASPSSEHAIVVSAADARVTKLKVRIDGVVVVRHYHLPESGVIRFRKPVELAGAATVEVEMLGDYGSTATVAVAECKAGSVAHEKGDGVDGGLSRAGTVPCGELVDWRFVPRDGFTGELVALGDRIVADSGTLIATGVHRFVATARPEVQLPQGGQVAASALRSVLTATDKVEAVQHLLAEMDRATATMSPADAAEWRSALFASALDPIADFAAIDAVGAALAGRRFVLPSADATPSLRGPAATAQAALDAPPMLVHVNGINASWPEAWQNLLALRDVAREYDLGEFQHALFYNQTGNLPPEVQLARCALTAWSLQYRSILTLAPASRDLLLRTTLAACRRPVRFLPGVADFLQSASEYLLIALNRPPTDPEVAALEEDLATALSDAPGVILVAHSQGNLHVRGALSRQVAMTARDRGRLSVISLAAPARAADQGVAAFNCWTVLGDIITIAGGTAACPSGPGNFDPLQTRLARSAAILNIPERLLRHSFRESYLELAPDVEGPLTARPLLAETILRHRAALEAADLDWVGHFVGTPASLATALTMSGSGASLSASVLFPQRQWEQLTQISVTGAHIELYRPSDDAWLILDRIEEAGRVILRGIYREAGIEDRAIELVREEADDGARLLFSDDFSGGLGAWVPRGDGSWTVNANGELMGDYGIGCGSSGCPQAQLLLADALQPGPGNWRIEVRSGLTQAYCCYQGGSVVNVAKFIVWVSDTQKEAFETGGSWVGLTAPATVSSVYTYHQAFPWALIGNGNPAVPTWRPSEWQTVALEKRGDEYSLYFNGALVYLATRTFPVPPRVGFNTYGAVRMDDFRLYRLP